MFVFRLLLIGGLLLLLPVSKQAVARPYPNPDAYPPAAPWNGYNPYARAPQAYAPPGNAYNPYARAPRPYYPANRYPVQPLPPAGYIRPGYERARQSYAAPVITRPTTAAPVKIPAERVKHKPRSTDSDTTDSNKTSGKKQEFIEALLPHIEKENQRLSTLRSEVNRLFARLDSGAPGQSEKLDLQKLAGKYRVDGDPLSSESARAELLRKIDIIPSSLALAQAANESAWGKSRFAQEANNLFGIWTYDKTRGLKPKNREQGKTHLVRIFDDFGDSVAYYMHTLNSHPAYEPLRVIRGKMRASRKVIDGHQLASGLEKYSAKGREYIELIQRLIRQHEWARLDSGNQQA